MLKPPLLTSARMRAAVSSICCGFHNVTRPTPSFPPSPTSGVAVIGIPLYNINRRLCAQQLLKSEIVGDLQTPSIHFLMTGPYLIRCTLLLFFKDCIFYRKTCIKDEKIYVFTEKCLRVVSNGFNPSMESTLDLVSPTR